jgi:hypothetical protein
MPLSLHSQLQRTDYLDCTSPYHGRESMASHLQQNVRQKETDIRRAIAQPLPAYLELTACCPASSRVIHAHTGGAPRQPYDSMTRAGGCRREK